MKKLILLFLILNVFSFSQPNRRNPVAVPQSFFNSEIILLPSTENSVTLYYSYTLPYKILVFEREGQNYEANFRLQVEIYDSLGSLVSRDFKDSKVVTKDFNQTTDNATYLHELLQMEVPSAKLELKAVISDLNSDKELPLKPEPFNTSEMFEKTVFPPLIVNTSKIKCDTSEFYSMASFGGSIPFSEDNYALLIPVTDTSQNSLHVKIINNDETVIDKEITESYLTNIELKKCDDEIILRKGNKTINTRNFVLDKINKNLYEGIVEIIIDKDEQDENDSFKKDVVWIDKPISFRNPELAIEYLKFIENQDVIADLLDSPEQDYTIVLAKHWVKYDPTPETSFNQLMKEYYERIDYAAEEFRGIGKENGVNSDRGKIYIRFGKPESIMRSSDRNGNIVETWSYKNPERNFIFVDKKGTGDFTLVEG